MPPRLSTSNSFEQSQFENGLIFGFSDEDREHETQAPKGNCFNLECFFIYFLAKRAKKSKKDEKAGETDKLLLEALEKKESVGETFGRTIAADLDKMEPKDRLAAQIEIQQVILKYTK